MCDQSVHSVSVCDQEERKRTEDMASYYDEHDCQPLGEGEQPNHLLHLARLLLDTGVAREWEMEYESVFHGRPSPPAAEKVVNELITFRVSPTQVEESMKCPICLKEYDEEEVVKKLPCKHHFHSSCILPWLQKTNTCPVCRHELPTDDEDYEEFRRQKARKKQREFELETLHDSMFG